MIDTLVYNYRYVFCTYVCRSLLEASEMGVTSIVGPGLIEEFSPRSQRQIKRSEGENGSCFAGGGRACLDSCITLAGKVATATAATG